MKQRPNSAAPEREKKLKVEHNRKWQSRYHARHRHNRPPAFGAIAQSVERLHGMQEVRGSNPRGSTFGCPEP